MPSIKLGRLCCSRPHRALQLFLGHILLHGNSDSVQFCLRVADTQDIRTARMPCVWGFLYVNLYVNFKIEKIHQKRRAYGTPDSHVVPHRSTDEACSGLTAQFGRDTVRFTEYGRRREYVETSQYLYSF